MSHEEILPELEEIDKRFKRLTEREKYLCQVSVALGLVLGAGIMYLSFIIWGGVLNV